MPFLFEKARASIHEFRRLHKGFLLTALRDGALVVVVACTAYISYGIALVEQGGDTGHGFSLCQKEPYLASEKAIATDAQNDVNIASESVLGASGASREPLAAPAGGGVVASKNGSKYHFPWCPGAGQIKEENKVWYADEEAAVRAGLEKAKNCN